MRSPDDDTLGSALVQVGIDLGILTSGKELRCWCEAQQAGIIRFAEFIDSRAAMLADVQLDVLEKLTRPLTEPHAAVQRARLSSETHAQLTPRERDVLVLLCQGLTAAAMARRLGLSPRTVTKHQENLYRKLGLSDRLAAVLYAQRLGIVISKPAS